MSAAQAPVYPTIEAAVGNTPLVALQRIGADVCRARGNVILGKLEGNNPAGSVKDRPAISMIRRAEERGEIQPGDTLIEATSGNTGIALAMAAAIRGYRMLLIMPEDLSIERAQTMKAFGAELILTPRSGGMEYARDLADSMAAQGKGRILDQFANPDNPRIHYETTGPEIWEQTAGRVTHFVSAMGTTGTITGVSHFLKSKNPQVRIIGATGKPASLPYRANMTLLDAMIAVGGLSEYAAGNKARLIRFDKERGHQKEFALRLSDLLRKGDSRANVMLKPGDVITEVNGEAILHSGDLSSRVGLAAAKATRRATICQSPATADAAQPLAWRPPAGPRPPRHPPPYGGPRRRPACSSPPLRGSAPARGRSPPATAARSPSARRSPG